MKKRIVLLMTESDHTSLRNVLKAVSMSGVVTEQDRADMQRSLGAMKDITRDVSRLLDEVEGWPDTWKVIQQHIVRGTPEAAKAVRKERWYVAPRVRRLVQAIRRFRSPCVPVRNAAGFFIRNYRRKVV